ncbi:MAG: 4Fe-4S binding protein, partial [Oscillospiraceae bacterium]
LKFGILAGFVVLLPLFALDILGQGAPWFCKLICPSGTLFAGLPLVFANESLRSAIGWLFGWKVFLLIALLLLSVVVYRPFCRYLCPLGAIYGLLNPVSLTRFSIDPTACTACGACQRACKLDIPVWKIPNSIECIRCGDCKAACPHGAIRSGGCACDGAAADRRFSPPRA